MPLDGAIVVALLALVWVLVRVGRSLTRIAEALEQGVSAVVLQLDDEEDD